MHALKRAGLAYWQGLDYVTYPDWEYFVDANPVIQADLAANTEECAGTSSDLHVHLLTKARQRSIGEDVYHGGDYFIFGKESAGLSRELISTHPSLAKRIPMKTDAALSNADTWAQELQRTPFRARVRRIRQLRRSKGICRDIAEPLERLRYRTLRSAEGQRGYPDLS